MIKHHLSLSALKDVLLHATHGDEAVDIHMALLPNPMGSAHGLHNGPLYQYSPDLPVMLTRSAITL